MFTASGLIVRFLKVFEKSSYQSVKWVRYLTKASGSYQVRVSGFVLFLKKRDIGILINAFGASSEAYIHACISFHFRYLSIVIRFTRHRPGSPLSVYAGMSWAPANTLTPDRTMDLAIIINIKTRQQNMEPQLI